MNPHGTASLSRHTTVWHGLTEHQQVRLTEILDHCIATLESGQTIDEAALVVRHPDLAEPLKEHLESIQFLCQATVGCRSDITECNSVSTVSHTMDGYRILSEMGRGGMGVVYEAEDMSLRRRVALKVLPFATLLDPKQIARFRNEAQAAGQLHHPHIVPVYAVGCDRGVHYFAMQLVEGQPLDVAIEELRAKSQQPLDLGTTLDARDITNDSTSPWRTFSTAGCERNPDFLRTIAKLAANVASALQHAHDVGILHRDIKPSNLLLDRTGKVWVSDFGFAHVPAAESMTLSGDVMGTIRYMSPEQASGRTQFVDHRSDVYSLGITLYEMATLTRAFESENREEFLTRIIAEEPTPPRQLNRAIPIDLETIILKAIAKEPTERYASAQDMEDDLRRFLDGKPTNARRPTLLDTATKWTRRHGRLVTLSMMLLLLAVVASGLAVWKIAAEQRRTAAALATAQTHFRSARDMLDQFGLQIAFRLQRVPGTESIRRDLLEQSLIYYRSFIAQAENDPQLNSDLALAYSQTARIQEQLGGGQGAAVSYTQAIALYEQLANQQFPAMQHRAELAKCLNNRGLVRWRLGQTEGAQQDLDRSIQLHRALQHAGTAERPRVQIEYASALCNRSVIHRHAGEPAEARKCLDHAIHLQRSAVASPQGNARVNQHLAVSLHNLAFQVASSEPELAQRACVEAIEIQQQLVDQHPDEVTFERDLALSYSNLGSLYSQAGAIAEALVAYQRAIELGEKVVLRAPSVVAHQIDLAVSINNLGRAQMAANDLDQSSRAFERARHVLESLIDRHGSNPELEALLGGVVFNRGIAEWRCGDSVTAHSFLADGNRRQRRAVELAPGNRGFAVDLDAQLAKYVEILKVDGEYVQAVHICNRRSELMAREPNRLHEIAEQVEQIADAADVQGHREKETVAWRELADRLRIGQVDTYTPDRDGSEPAADSSDRQG